MLALAVLSGVFTVVSVVLLCARVFPVKLIFGYASLFDVSFHIAMVVVFVGTLGGAITAVIGGVMMSAILTLGRYVFGYSKVRWIKHCGFVVIDFPSPLMQQIKGNIKCRSASA